MVSAPQDVIPTWTYSPVSSTQKAGPPESPCNVRDSDIKSFSVVEVHFVRNMVIPPTPTTLEKKSKDMRDTA